MYDSTVVPLLRGILLSIEGIALLMNKVNIIAIIFDTNCHVLARLEIFFPHQGQRDIYQARSSV